MILERLDTQGTLISGAALAVDLERDVLGAVYRLAVDFDGGTRDARVYLDAEGCVAVAYALLDAVRWALPGGVEGCDDRHVREACEALYDRAVIVEGVDATDDGEVVL